MKKLLIGLLLVGLITTPTLATSPINFTTYNRQTQIDFNVETQPGVQNTTGCVWDPDDYSWNAGTGILRAGQRVTFSEACIVSDNAGHLIQLRSGDPRARGTIQIPGYTIQTINGEACISIEQDANNVASLPEVSGGRGLRFNPVFTIENPTRRRLSFTVFFDINRNWPFYQQQCPSRVSPLPNSHVDENLQYVTWDGIRL